jgi:hypothetical protein
MHKTAEYCEHPSIFLISISKERYIDLLICLSRINIRLCIALAAVAFRACIAVQDSFVWVIPFLVEVTQSWVAHYVASWWVIEVAPDWFRIFGADEPTFDASFNLSNEICRIWNGNRHISVSFVQQSHAHQKSDQGRHKKIS